MLKNILMAVVATACLFSSIAQAAGVIAVIDRNRAVLETAQAKERLKALTENADFIANKKEYDAAVDAVRALYAKAQKEAPTMSQEQQAELGAKIQEKEADVKHVTSKLQAAEQNLARDILKDSNAKLSQVIKKLIDEKKIGLLIPLEATLYATPDYDITAEVTELMNTL